MVSRSWENYREILRKYEFGGSKLTENARIISTPLMLKWVDSEALTKARVGLFRQQNEAIRTLTRDSGDAEQAEKWKDSWRAAGNRLDVRDFDYDQTVEELYFNYFQHGFNGSPSLDRPGTAYKCPCGVSMEMDLRTAPHQCPICKRLTPVGELAEEGVIRR